MPRYCPISGRRAKFRITFRVYTPYIPLVVVNMFLFDFGVVFGYATLYAFYRYAFIPSRDHVARNYLLIR